MAVEGGLGAIIGGSVAGAIVLIAIIAVIVCLCCGKRRRKKEREQKKFQQLTPHTSPSHSQPSSLGHGPLPPEPRLPKVGSNGLWMGTPGIYAATPSPAYYYGRPGGKPPSHVMQSAVLPRASSETRIPQRDRQVPGGGPGIYAAGGSQQRIYHSQQLASLTPLYEVVDPRDGSVYDVYQIGGGSKTKLLQDSGKASDRHSKSSNKVQRSHSDAVPDPARRPHRHRPSHEDHRSSKTGSVTKEMAQVHEPKGKTTDGNKSGTDNEGFVKSSENLTEEVKTTAVVGSATDSMKLLANNRTDDQKKVVYPDSENKQPSPESAPVTPPVPDLSLHYTYGGDIYAVPDKEENRRRSRSDNPILARMQDMILEQTEAYEPGHVPDPVTDLAETGEPLMITHTDGNPDQGPSIIQNPIYQEVEEVVPESEAVIRSVALRTHDDHRTGQVVATVRSAADELGSGANGTGDSAPSSGDVAVDDVAASSALTSLREAGDVGGEGGEWPEVTPMVKGTLETRWSTDTDAATDELSRAGKHISVTAEAFEFLDTYLSDEDGADIHSPPNSPVLSGRDELMMY